MEIFKGAKIIGASLIIDAPRILIISDLHLGQEESMRDAGFLFPQNQFKELFQNIKQIMKQTSPKIIVINGDLKHEFRKISRDEWKQISELLLFLKSKAEVILIKGNHDKILEPMAKSTEIKLTDYFFYKDIYICHGDKIPKDTDFKKAKYIIIGHEHPAISLKDGVRVEKYKCFLKGTYEKKTLVVLPAFNPLTEGTDVLKEKLLSPFLDSKKIRNFEVYIYEDKVYYFGKAKDLE